MSERRIDNAIEQAVRDLMNVDADAAFRARVVERLRKPKSRAPFWRQLSIVSAAAAIAVIALVMTRDGEQPAVEAPPAAVASTVAPQPPVEPAAAEPAPRVGRPPAPRPARRRPANPTIEITRGALVAAVTDEAFGPPLPGGVAPLSDIRPIELAPIAPAPITTTEITVAPIAQPSELVIAPLDPRIERE